MTFIEELNSRNTWIAGLREKGRTDDVLKEEAELMEITRGLDEHPDDYDGVCLCKTCHSYSFDM
jgi:hypothetical protein